MPLGDAQDRENADRAVRAMAEAAVRQHTAAQATIMQSLVGMGWDAGSLVGECSVDDAGGEFRTTILGPMPGRDGLAELAVVVTRTEGLVAPAVVVAHNQKGVVLHAAHDRGT